MYLAIGKLAKLSTKPMSWRLNFSDWVDSIECFGTILTGGNNHGFNSGPVKQNFNIRFRRKMSLMLAGALQIESYLILLGGNG